MGAEEVRRLDLWLNADSPDGSTRFTDLSAVIVNHERIIRSMSEEGPPCWLEGHNGAHLDYREPHWFDLS